MKIPNSFNRMGISPKKDEKPVMPTDQLVFYWSLQKADPTGTTLPQLEVGPYMYAKMRKFIRIFKFRNDFNHTKRSLSDILRPKWRNAY